MILNFEEYLKSFPDDDYLLESMSISMDVDAATDKVVKFIEDAIADNKLSVVDQKDFHDCSCDVLRFGEDMEIEIFGCPCTIDMIFFNFMGTPDEQELENMGLSAQMGFGQKNDGGISKIRLDLDGKAVLVNGKLNTNSKSVISHELRHGFIDSKIYNNVPVLTADKRIAAGNKWRKIYGIVTGYIKCTQDNEIMLIFEDNRFPRIMFSIYQSDVSEVAAFTQQAYEACKKCKSKDEVKKKMKTTDLHNMLQSFKYVLEILSNDNVRKMYDDKKDQYGMRELPTTIQLIKLIEKRYRKAFTNYGNVIAFLCDRFDEKDGYKLIDVKY